MPNFAEFTDNSAVQSEIVNLNNTLLTNLPIMQAFSQMNLDMMTASGAISQAMLEWDMPTQMEGLNTNLLESFALQGGISQAMLEWDMPTQMMGLGTTILGSFATQDMLSQTLSDGLNANLLANFTSQGSLTQTLFELLNTNLLAAFLAQDSLSEALFGGLNTNLLTSFGVQYSLSQTQTDNLSAIILASFLAQGSLLQTLSKNLINSISISSGDIVDYLWGLNFDLNILRKDMNSIYDNLATTLTDYFSDTEPKELARKSNALAVIGNKLAEDANTLTKIGNGIAIAGNLMAGIGLALEAAHANITAMSSNPFSGAAAIALAVAAGITALGALASIPTYASGGFPSTGQLFYAREAGPELIGTIGSRSAVVNNDQIVEAVSAGVYKAVKEAMNGNGSGSGENLTINIFEDGVQKSSNIISAAERRNRRDGRTIFPLGI